MQYSVHPSSKSRFVLACSTLRRCPFVTVDVFPCHTSRGRDSILLHRQFFPAVACPIYIWRGNAGRLKSRLLRYLVTLEFPSGVGRCSFLSSSFYFAKMSSDCANCDCADKTQCPKKKGFQMDGIVETSYEMGHGGNVFLENDCKCGPNCKCGTCSCHS